MSAKTRRTFLTQVAAASASAALAPTIGCARKRQEPKKISANTRARVVLVQADPDVVISGNKVDRGQLRRMLEVGLRKLAGTGDARAALSRWVRPSDTVGLKVNCLAGKPMSTHPELVEELVALLEKTGLRRRQAVVFDRANRDLRRGGFPVRETGNDYRSIGNDRAGFEKEVRVMPTGASRFSQVVTHLASVLINLPILKDHGLAGITGALKNNFGLVHNPNKFHLNGCDPHVAEVNNMPFVKAKQRLVICDALRVQVEGGPAYHPAGAQLYGGLLLATDPVALDRVAWEILEQLRKQKKLPTLTKDKRRPVHILTAAKKGLGVADRARIDLIKVNVRS
jgi:uncharacterized protein (DUF362 family)